MALKRKAPRSFDTQAAAAAAAQRAGGAGPGPGGAYYYTTSTEDFDPEELFNMWVRGRALVRQMRGGAAGGDLAIGSGNCGTARARFSCHGTLGKR